MTDHSSSKSPHMDMWLNVKSKTSFNSCVCLFSLSLPVSSVLLWNDFPDLSLFFFFILFLAPNSTVSFSIYLLFSSLSLLWFLRWLLPQSSPVFPLSLSLSLFPLPRSATPSWIAGYYGWRLVRGKSLSLSWIQGCTLSNECFVMVECFN